MIRAAIAVFGAAALLTTPTAALAQVEGQAVYDKWCAGCHGVDGSGNGPGAVTMLPRPRDFTLALYQIRSTATGELPTDEDMMHVIDVGMPGTAMPGWEDVLSRAERDAVVEYLKTFSRFFQGDAPTPLDFGRAPRGSDEVIARGAEVYQTLECWRCHGQQGRGDGESTPTLNDDLGFPVYAADLTEGWMFNGGGHGGGYLPAAADGPGRHSHADLFGCRRRRGHHRRGPVGPRPLGTKPLARHA